MKHVGENIWGLGFIFKILSKKKRGGGEKDEGQVKKCGKTFKKLLNLDLVLFSLLFEI